LMQSSLTPMDSLSMLSGDVNPDHEDLRRRIKQCERQLQVTCCKLMFSLVDREQCLDN
jgi:hypothetical protein